MAASSKLTKHEKLSMWRARIAYATERRQCFMDGEGSQGSPGWVPGANFAIDVYRGKSKPTWWSDSDPWVHIGKLKSAVRAAVPSLMYSNPRFRVFPARIDIENGVDVSYQRAHAKELWLNHVWSETNGTQHARNGILNAFFTLGAAKCGYRCHFEDDKKRGVFAKDEVTGEYVLDEAGDPTLERGEFLKGPDGELLRDEYGVPVPHPGTLTKEDWFVEVMDPALLLFDTESGPDFFQHRWFIEEWVRPLSEVKNDPRYPAALRKRLTASESVRGPASQRKSIFESKQPMDGDRAAVEQDEERLRGYDIYDFQNNEYIVIPDSGVSGGTENDEFLIDGPMPDGMEHGPSRFLKYTEDVGAEWYPIPDAIDMALVNVEYNITRSQMMIHREHTKTRYLEMPGAFESEGTSAEEERAKFAHGPDGTLIKVSANNAIMPAPKAQLDSSFMQAIPNIALDFNEVGGMPGESRGVADADTATQASILASGAELRNNDRRDNQVQKWLCEIGRALLISGQQNASLDTVVMEKIIEQAGVAPFRPVKLSPQELLGEFEVTVEVGSTLAKSDPRTNAQLFQLITAFSQNPWMATVKGLTRRALDGINLDPVIAEELAAAAEAQVQRENPPQQPGPEDMMGQVLGDTLSGGTANQQAGAPTGAPIN